MFILIIGVPTDKANENLDLKDFEGQIKGHFRIAPMVKGRLKTWITGWRGGGA